MTVISVRARDLDSSNVFILGFYDDLRSIKISIPKADRLCFVFHGFTQYNILGMILF